MTARRAGSTDGLALLCWDTVVGRFEILFRCLSFQKVAKSLSTLLHSAAPQLCDCQKSSLRLQTCTYPPFPPSFTISSADNDGRTEANRRCKKNQNHNIVTTIFTMIGRAHMFYQ
jgi:hypothetical protein